MYFNLVDPGTYLVLQAPVHRQTLETEVNKFSLEWFFFISFVCVQINQRRAWVGSNVICLGIYCTATTGSTTGEALFQE